MHLAGVPVPSSCTDKPTMPGRFAPPRNPALLRALLAFAIAVAVAVLAWAALLLPDVTAQSADAMSGVIDGVGRVVEAAGAD